MRRFIALQFSGWPQQSDPPPAVDANAEKQAVGSGGAASVAAAVGAGRSGGAIWALDGLLEPVAVRFRFHFEEERPTNRVDRKFAFLWGSTPRVASRVCVC